MPPRKRPPSAPSIAAPSLLPALHLQGFLQYYRAEVGSSVNTILAYENDLKQFLRWLSSQQIESVVAIDLKVLSGYLQELHERQLAATSVSRKLVAIKMFFRYLVLEAVVPESVVELLSSPKLWQYLPTVLSPETVDKLLAAPGYEDKFPRRDRALLTLLYATGCRASEMTGMRVQDVHLEETYCRCLGKGNKERIVNLNPVAIHALQEYLALERPQMVGKREQDALFVTRTGRGLSRIMAWQLVKRYAARIGCRQKISPHTLRHSFATHMLAGGAEIRALQEMLGHASIRTTQVYTHVEHSRLKAVHRKCHPRG